MMKSRSLLHILLISLLIFCLPAGVVTACALGRVNIAFIDVLGALVQHIPGIGGLIAPGSYSDLTMNGILLNRLPRAVLSLLVGAGLACAGAAFQGLFKNPLADPYFVGVSAGAALGASVAIVLGVSYIFGISGIGIFAFAAALATVLAVYRLASGGGRASTLHLVLAGIAVSAFLTACFSLVMALNREKMDQIISWTMGSFQYTTWEETGVFAVALCIGFSGMFIFARDLNVMLSGEETAHTLGVPVERIKLILLILASFVGAVAVAVSGIIWFVGLIVPHAVRLVTGPDHKLVFPYSALFGALFLLIADILARVILPSGELPVGVITALCGAPFFIYLLLKNKREYL
jgi:iron complex transport system permease protein